MGTSRWLRVPLMRPWHLRWLEPLVYLAAAIAGTFVAMVSVPDGFVGAREMYGLWALALLLASMIIGPLVAVAPWLPLKSHLMTARRPVGVSAFGFALVHVGCYVLPVLSLDWRAIFSPGTLWIVGLTLGLTGLALMAPLAWTSRDASVVSLGAARWKRLHRLVYLILPVVFLHAVLVGTDFGAHRAPDVKEEADMGSLIAFLGLMIVWLVLFIWRWRRTSTMRRIGRKDAT